MKQYYKVLDYQQANKTEIFNQISEQMHKTKMKYSISLYICLISLTQQCNCEPVQQHSVDE